MASLNERNQGIDHFKITTRIQDGLTSFALDYITPYKPEGLVTGEMLDISLYDTGTPGETAVITGRIQNIKNDFTDKTKYQISGRDGGFELVNNQYNLDCSLTANTTLSPLQILENILLDTYIEIGGGTPDFDPNITFTNNGNLRNGYCGIFQNKKQAIDQLFILYAQLAGLNKIRWYIDNQNKLRWFETGKNRGNVIKYSLNNSSDFLIGFSYVENSENIVNQQTVYGCDDTIHSTQKVQASINQHGLQVGKDIKDSSIKTNADAAARAKQELDQKAWPIYTATMIMDKYVDILVGQQVQFIDLTNYTNIVFTCVQKDIEGKPADIKTTLQYSTDENAIAPPNTVDVVQAVVKNAVDSSKPTSGTVVDVSSEDCNNILVRPDGSNTPVNANTTSNCSYTNVG